jgi:hypothetical protein
MTASADLDGSPLAPQLLQHGLTQPDGVKLATLCALDDFLCNNLGQGVFAVHEIAGHRSRRQGP